VNLRDDATKVVALKTLRDAVDVEYEATRRRVLDGLRAARKEFNLKSVRVTLPDDTPIATITLTDPKPAIVIADEGAFTAWVAENYPAEVETITRVRSAWQRAFVTRLEASFDPVADPRTGEVIPGLAVAPASEPHSFSLRSLPGGREEIIRAWRSGALDPRRLLALDGGET
jgi:hypothetical protein